HLTVSLRVLTRLTGGRPGPCSTHWGREAVRAGNVQVCTWGIGAEGWGAENGRSVNQAFIPSTLFPVEPTLRSAAGEPTRSAANLRQRAAKQTLTSHGSGSRQSENNTATDSSGRAIVRRRVISRVVHLSPMLWH